MLSSKALLKEGSWSVDTCSVRSKRPKRRQENIGQRTSMTSTPGPNDKPFVFVSGGGRS